MRILFALIMLAFLSGCRVFTEPLYGNHHDCDPGWSWSSGSCTRNYQPPAPVITVITIGPSRVYADSADSFCFQLSPAPASIRQGQSYRFQNNTGYNVTIVGSDQVPWITIGAGSTSQSLSSSSPGVYGFGVQSCRGVAGTPWYGVLDVTVD
jgi:hypothetical protein